MQHKVLVLLCLLGLTFAGQRIPTIPGYNGPELTQFTGYIEVDQTYGKHLFYWFVESQNNPSTDPLVVWFQGGPGCSGFEALFSEHGPYVPNYSGGVDYFPITWTSIANVLYLEQPAGVGFSYATDPKGLVSSDSISAQDNYIFLEKFLQEYPQFYGRPMWLAGGSQVVCSNFAIGESYGGVYIPSLVNLILQNTSSPLYSQLAGLTIGNPVIDCSGVNTEALQFELFYFHGLVSYSLYNQWTSAFCSKGTQLTPQCAEILVEAMKQIGTFYQQKRSTEDEPNLDPDDLYEDFCTGNGTLSFAVNTGWPNQCYPLVNREEDYLNRDEVQRAIFAKPTNWSECTSDIIYEQSHASMLPIYQQLFSQRPDVRVMIFSGDVDIATVPFAGTQACLAQLNDTVKSVWSPWFVNGATAGYFEQYQHYTYATIKGAGHMCPQYQPLNTFNLWSRFLWNQDLSGDVPQHIPTVTTEGRRLHQSRGGF